MSIVLKSAFNGDEPHKFQLDITEVLILGLDAIAPSDPGTRQMVDAVSLSK